MAGLPFQVGRFAHTMRVHLMQEHLGENGNFFVCCNIAYQRCSGVDTDALANSGGPQASKATGSSAPIHEDQNEKPWDPESEQETGKDST